MLWRPEIFSHLGKVSLSNPVPSTCVSLGGGMKKHPAIKEADIRALVSSGEACLSSGAGGLVPQPALNLYDISSVFFYSPLSC